MERPSAAGRWLDRNAKWFLPLGIAAFLAVGVGGMYAFLDWFDGYMRGLPPYRMALQELRSHREAAQFLGPPIEAAGRVMGNFETNPGKSAANLTIPVQGTEHEGRLFVVASAVGDDWTLHAVTLQVANPKRSFPIVEPK